MPASYADISETVTHFLTYESKKQTLLEYEISSVIENDKECERRIRHSRNDASCHHLKNLC
jgi:hypothetical protein